MLSPATVENLEMKLRGQLLRPDHPQYDEARAIWNSMIDKRPDLIARCTSAADVIEAVDFAREHDLLVAVRGGGHNVAGTSACDGGLMIDLSAMRAVQVDPKARTAQTAKRRRSASPHPAASCRPPVSPG